MVNGGQCNMIDHTHAGVSRLGPRMLPPKKRSTSAKASDLGRYWPGANQDFLIRTDTLLTRVHHAPCHQPAPRQRQKLSWRAGETRDVFTSNLASNLKEGGGG